MTQTVTEKRAVIREREAFARGAIFYSEAAATSIRNDAKHLYPLPKELAPRTVVDPETIFIEWTLQANMLTARDVDTKETIAFGHSCYFPTHARVAMWTDLFANPTEEVDADE